jgi:GYF domain 2
MGSGPEFSDDESWHISRGNSRAGPFRFSDLVEAVDLQLIEVTDFVWHHRWADWRQVKSVPSLASLAGLSDCDDLMPTEERCGTNNSEAPDSNQKCPVSELRTARGGLLRSIRCETMRSMPIFLELSDARRKVGSA